MYGRSRLLMMMMMLMVLFVPSTVTFGGGPPLFTPEHNPFKYTYCVDLTPGHQTPLLNPADSPVTFKVSPIAGSDNLKVDLVAELVGGFIVQGRDAAGNAIGLFSSDLDPEKAAIVPGCVGNTTVGHTSSWFKQNVSFLWRPPSDGRRGTVTFHGTFVQYADYTKNWGVVKSDPVPYVSNVESKPARPGETTLFPNVAREDARIHSQSAPGPGPTLNEHGIGGWMDHGVSEITSNSTVPRRSGGGTGGAVHVQLCVTTLITSVFITSGTIFL